MRAVLASIVVVGSLLITGAAQAQGGAGAAPAVSPSLAAARFTGAHLMTPRGRERLDDMAGTFASDARTRRLKFEVDGGTVFEAHYDRVTALHYEPNRFPKRSFGRASYYLVIQATRGDGSSLIQAIRWTSKDEAQRAIDTVTRHVGREVERTEANRSLLGLGIHLAAGDLVYVTDRAGRRETGRVVALSPRSLRVAVADAPGGSRTYHDGDVRRVELGNRPISGYNSTFTVLGACLGVVPGVVLGGNMTADGGSYTAALGTLAGTVALGGFVGAAVDRHTTKTVYESAAVAP
jgi:hypothetical protein